MIVRDLGDAWQIVLQTDHADLSAALARAWATPLAPSLVLATERHDDGWAVWEQSPRSTRTARRSTSSRSTSARTWPSTAPGSPRITEEDAYAGLLVSMHGAGIYRQRYGLDTSLGLTRAAEVQGDVDAFVAEQEAKFGGDPGERRRDYELLQLFDRLSLYFCMRDVVGGEAAEVQGYRLEPVGPWQVQLAPFPFAESPARFSLLRRVLPKDGPSTSSPQRPRRRRSRSSNPREVRPLRGPTTSADELVHRRASAGRARTCRARRRRTPSPPGSPRPGPASRRRAPAAAAGRRTGSAAHTSFRLFRFS